MLEISDVVPMLQQDQVKNEDRLRRIALLADEEEIVFLCIYNSNAIPINKLSHTNKTTTTGGKKIRRRRIINNGKAYNNIFYIIYN